MRSAARSVIRQSPPTSRADRRERLETGRNHAYRGIDAAIGLTNPECVLLFLRRSPWTEANRSNFDLDGLDPRPGDFDGHVGRIELILNETATDAIAQAFELPRDRNGDGDAADPNVVATRR